MAVDYLSALNVGSGLNVTQIVDALVDAEKAPREATLNTKIEEKTDVIEKIITDLRKENQKLKKENQSLRECNKKLKKSFNTMVSRLSALLKQIEYFN